MKNIQFSVIDALRDATKTGCTFISFLYTTKGTGETSRYLINFGIDEYINPRLRVMLSPRAARKLAGRRLRPQLGFTPVVRRTPEAAPMSTKGNGS